MSIREPICQECGNRITESRRAKMFCSPACRQTFNNRRMQRGADMYDLFRALRRERGKAKDMNIWTVLCQLEKRWNDEDTEARPGRKSYMPPSKALTNLYDKGSLQRGDILVK